MGLCFIFKFTYNKKFLSKNPLILCIIIFIIIVIQILMFKAIFLPEDWSFVIKVIAEEEIEYSSSGIPADADFYLRRDYFFKAFCMGFVLKTKYYFLSGVDLLFGTNHSLEYLHWQSEIFWQTYDELVQEKKNLVDKAWKHNVREILILTYFCELKESERMVFDSAVSWYAGGLREFHYNVTPFVYNEYLPDRLHKPLDSDYLLKLSHDLANVPPSAVIDETFIEVARSGVSMEDFVEEFGNFQQFDSFQEYVEATEDMLEAQEEMERLQEELEFLQSLGLDTDDPSVDPEIIEALYPEAYELLSSEE